MSCDRCDTWGGEKTYANQASIPLNGKVRCIDWCIHRIVAALNAGGVETVASCCGHGRKDGNIVLADGRTLVIKPAPVVTADLDKCPGCGGPADNGHSRDLPPVPYYCTRCDPDVAAIEHLEDNREAADTSASETFEALYGPRDYRGTA